MTDKHRAEFTLGGYAALISEFKSLGYIFCAFADARCDKPHLIMRHDVDFCPRRAMRIAEVEKDLGVHSTFFFLVSSEFYNIHSLDTVLSLRKIKDMGHHIGLHFDSAMYDASEIHEAAEAECQSLAQVIGDVEIISLHRPIARLQGASTDLAGRPHTYQPQFFFDIDYCSDSAGEWAHGHPLNRNAVRDRRALQLLTHPIWWADDMATSPVEKIVRFYSDRAEFLRSELQRNLKKGAFAAPWINEVI